MSRAVDGVGYVLAAGVWTTAVATLPAGLACAFTVKLLTLPRSRVSYVS